MAVFRSRLAALVAAVMLLGAGHPDPARAVRSHVPESWESGEIAVMRADAPNWAPLARFSRPSLRRRAPTALLPQCPVVASEAAAKFIAETALSRPRGRATHGPTGLSPPLA